MIKWKVVPIQKWPVEPTKKRKGSPFRAAWANAKTGTLSTLDLLNRELKALAGKDVLLQIAVTHDDIRLDGKIRANARPSHPGVLLTFDSKFGPLTYPCDRFTDWQSNVRAIALALEALRKVDRYGVTRRGEQYTGWKALPAEIKGGPHLVLSRWSGMAEDEVRENPRRAYLLAAKRAHPDVGGTAEAMSEVGEAGHFLGVPNG